MSQKLWLTWVTTPVSSANRTPGIATAIRLLSRSVWSASRVLARCSAASSRSRSASARLRSVMFVTAAR